MQAPPTNKPTQYLGTEGEDPTSPFWGSGNYVGPYWSNGNVQSSIEWGDKSPVHQLDELARNHDAAYAHFADRKHREAADEIFAEGANKLKIKYGKKLADDPKFAAAAVQYGNYAGRQASKLFNYTTSSGPVIGLARFGVDNIIEMQKRLTGSYLKSERKDVLRFYETDPYKGRYTLNRDTEPIRRVVVAPAPKTGSDKTVNSKDDSVRQAQNPLSGSGGGEARVKNISQPDQSDTQILVENQRRRFQRYKALHDAAQASIGQPRVYRRPQSDVGLAVPEYYRKQRKKRNAVRPL